MLLFISGSEILVILLFVLLFFGSNKIPEFARMLGKGMREFRKATEDIKREINKDTQGIRDDLNDVKKDLP